MAHATNGSFVWFDLLTSEPAKAVEFYCRLIGWKAQPFNAEYTMFVGSQGPVGGAMKLPDQASKMGSPPLWTSNVQVGDVDASVAEAKKLGARVYLAPTDIPNVGRYAVIADPQGASINVFKSKQAVEVQDVTKPGEITWSELATTDHESAFIFYSKLFAWKRSRDFDMGPMGKYVIFNGGGRDLGGMFTKPKDRPAPAAWLYYIEVPNLAAAIESAKAHGGKLLNGPVEVPGGAHIAQLLDPQGAAFALHELKKA